MEKNKDVKLYTGRAYDLKCVLSFDEKYEAFILETGLGIGRFYADLGRRRYLCLEGTAYLVLVTDRSVRLFRLKADGNELHEGLPAIRMKDVFGHRGIKCSTSAEASYLKWSQNWWKHSLFECDAVFSKNGYATQHYDWNDCSIYDFEIRFVKKDHLLIDGQNIEAVTLFNGSRNVMKRVREYVELVLTGPAEMSMSGFEDRIKMAGLEDDIKNIKLIRGN